MFCSADVGFAIIMYYGKTYFFKKNKSLLYFLKKEFKNTIFKIIQVNFNHIKILGIT